MELYRITLTKYASQLFAPGYPGRWNSKGVGVIYCSWSRSLACLENLVHRSNMVLSDIFSVMIIHVDDDLDYSLINRDTLSDSWHLSNPESYRECQMIGDTWYKKNENCILEIPSVIIQAESNFVINPSHPDFKKVKLIGVESFSFDQRVFQKSFKKKKS